MPETSELRVGLTATFPCSYLENKEEQLIMLIEPELNAQQYYPALMAIGFRRSGDQVYRPQCPECNGCESLRIKCNDFVLSKSQKRLLNKNKKFTTEISSTPQENYFSLYQRYIDQIHKDGVMYPAKLEQFDSFIACSWGKPIFLEIYDNDKLIAVSVTDQLKTTNSSAWSAFYCFYDPDYTANSLGKFAVLQQLHLAKQQHIDFLYLGYYIHNCQKMNYKNQFNPHQRFINQQWEQFD
ncbi:arginyltransferase [Psychromonas sp.]|nr:arginyltransferase [Psychromonas sp.]